MSVQPQEGLEGIAVVGMAGRFPKAKDIAEYWENLRLGRECLITFSEDEIVAAGVPASSLFGKRVRSRGVLEGVDLFDAAFFRYSPKEAEVMDPQQRVFLELAWEALENAGYDNERVPGPVGVFAGAGINTYFANNVSACPEVLEAFGMFPAIVLNEKDFIATRAAYQLNLRGPALCIQTACSTSLVAVCSACQSLLNYECDMALAGAAAALFPQCHSYIHEEGGMISLDGHCRPFDKNATGTLFSDGAGVVVLRRLDEAVAAGDNILAVIKGFAVNNDGTDKAGFTAPSVKGQAEVVQMAQVFADTPPDSITYIEAHGTATPLGDPIEIAALTQAFRKGTDKKQFCAIGSVKSNIGHLDAAAGVAGLIKTVLAVYYGEIPPTLHFEEPNPQIDFAATPFYVVDRLTEWKPAKGPRRAGVSSFGIGGTNAHVVLEEAPVLPATSDDPRGQHLLLLSAKTPAALDAATTNLLTHLQRTPLINLADAAFTLQTGRHEFSQRRSLVCRDVADAIAALQEKGGTRLTTGSAQRQKPPVAFMFPGQGAQRVGMGRHLYATAPVFRQHFDRCAESLRSDLGLDLREVVFAKPEREAWAKELLIQTRVTQPALFAIEFALAKLWMSWGVQPAAMIGHSVGEYVAACLAGVFSVDDGLKLIATRGRLIQQEPRGTMLAILHPAEEILPLLNGSLSMAAVNAPALCVASGPDDAIQELEAVLAGKEIVTRRLQTSHAFHSVMMEPVMAPFAEVLRGVALHAPNIPYVSNVTAAWITEAEATDPDYWNRHLRQTVLFADGVAELLKSDHVLLEVGPGTTLTTLTRQHTLATSSHTIAASLPARKDGSEWEGMLAALGQLWQAGVKVDWGSFHGDQKRRRVPLPTYPFERKRYWIQPARPASARAAARRSDEEPALDAGNDGQQQLTPDQSASARSATRDEPFLDSRLAAIFSQVLGLDHVGINDSFFDLGGNSLLAVNIIAKVEKTFGVRLPLASLIEAPTVVEFCRLVTEKQAVADKQEAAKQQAVAASPCLVPLNSSGSATPLFLMHSHGGNILEYVPLARHFKNDRPVYAIQSRGLDGSPTAALSMEEMAAAYLQEIRLAQPRGPYILAGFCFGGYLALEAARLLRDQQEEVEAVILIDSGAKAYPRFRPGTTFLHRRWYATQYRAALEWSELAGLSFKAKCFRLMTRTRRAADLLQSRIEMQLDRLPRSLKALGLGHSLVYHFERIALANTGVWEQYWPQPYDGRVLFLRAEHQPPGIVSDDMMGWDGLLVGDVRVEPAPGFRQTVLNEPNVTEIARSIKETLARPAVGAIAQNGASTPEDAGGVQPPKFVQASA